MKTIITIAFILISSVCYGQDWIENAEVMSSHHIGTKIGESMRLIVVCIDGYKYVVVRKEKADSCLSITQMFERVHVRSSVPIKCKDKQ